MPTLEQGYWFGYWRDNRDPTATEAVPPMLVGYPDFLEIWFNQSSGDVFLCPDNTQNAMVWNKIITTANIDSYIPSIPSLPFSIANGGTGATTAASARTNLGFNLNSTRAPSSVSLAFNTSRQPNTTHDVLVSANISFSSILSLSDQVDIQSSPDNSTWTSLGQQKQQISLGVNIINQLIAFIPAGYYYKIIRVSGSNSTISSIYETTM